jgi:hypothetical protein
VYPNETRNTNVFWGVRCYTPQRPGLFAPLIAGFYKQHSRMVQGAHVYRSEIVININP